MKYALYDLEITIVGDPKTFNCSHISGETILVQGENLYFKKGTKRFSHYALATLMPYIAAKQRVADEADWMYFESDIACPDPLCGAIFRITRKHKRSYSYEPINKVY